MSVPLRFVATTYNLWASNRWPEREQPLRAFVRAMRPDILCLQELRAETRALLDEELPAHRRVDDPFEGWLREGNIYWSTALFEWVEHGAEPIGMLEAARRLFWARLRVKGGDRTLLVSTAHYTWQGNKREREEGFSPRLEQATRTLEALGRLAPESEPVLFMGDLNDAINPIRRLREGGLRDSFTCSGLYPLPTHPARPTAAGSPQVLDWQFHRGPLRVLNTAVVDFYSGDLAPSDHKPVTVTYGWDD